MRAFVVFLMLVINLALSSTVLGSLRLYGIQPDFTVLIIVSYAVLRGDIEGAVVGFFAGLMQDMFFGDILGLSAMLGCIVGYVCGKPFKDFFPENDFLPLILSGVGALFFASGSYFFTYLFQGETDFFYYFNRRILAVSLYTMVFTIPVYRLVYIINARLEKDEKTRRRRFF